jgi:hypothetical protein
MLIIVLLFSINIFLKFSHIINECSLVCLFMILIVKVNDFVTSIHLFLLINLIKMIFLDAILIFIEF